MRPESSHQKAQRVLVVDDDALLRMLIRQSLEQHDLQILEAVDGLSGIATFERERPDAVLLDVRMPRMDGFETCKRIRALPGGGEIPILMLTGIEDSSAVSQAYDAGATDFATKPVHWEVLGHRVRYLLRASAAHQRLKRSERRLGHAQRAAGLGWWEYDVATHEFELSDHILDLLGLSPDPVHQREELQELLLPRDGEMLSALMQEVLASGVARSTEVRVLSEKAKHKTFWCQLTPASQGAGGSATRILGTVQDVTEHRAQQRRIQHLSDHDPLTNLPNRSYVQALLGRTISGSVGDHQSFGILFLDLDNFKLINDTVGHSTGDEILRQVAGRTSETLRQTDRFLSRPTGGRWGETLARVGGDEFAVVLRGLGTAEGLKAVAHRLMGALSAPYEVEGQTFSLTASCGGAIFPEHGRDAGTLFRNAESAIHRAKAVGRQSYRLYRPEMNQGGMARLKMEADLRRAIQEESFFLVYQPQISIPTGKTVGVEALIRWRHPTEGIISPIAFIPVAEETGMIREIGAWVLKESCARLARWRALGHCDLTISVNVSARQLSDRRIQERVLEALSASSLPPEALELELTESALMENRRLGLAILTDLKALGVKVAIDDFGTGYSSLGKLRHLPIDTLKIDRSFITDLTQDGPAAAVVQAIVTMGLGLGQTIVAEGIETEEQLETLAAMGCPIAQGYLFSRPLEVDALETFLARNLASVAA